MFAKVLQAQLFQPTANVATSCLKYYTEDKIPQLDEKLGPPFKATFGV